MVTNDADFSAFHKDTPKSVDEWDAKRDRAEFLESRREQRARIREYKLTTGKDCCDPYIDKHVIPHVMCPLR